MNIETYLDIPEIHQLKVVSPSDVPFSQDVADACKANACGKYGTCWTCPPGIGYWREWETKIKSYEFAAVFTCKYDLEDSFDFEGMMRGKDATKDLLIKIKHELNTKGEDFLALGCSGCDLCRKCTYPDNPCRFPEKAILSVEACGINVVELSQKIGIKYNNGTNTVTYFCIILFNR